MFQSPDSRGRTGVGPIGVLQDKLVCLSWIFADAQAFLGTVLDEAAKGPFSTVLDHPKQGTPVVVFKVNA